jgi:putative photosynthetic complex assembly protein 2
VNTAAPILATIALWFASTALIVWLANRARSTFPASLMISALAGAGGLLLIVYTAADREPAAAYLSFIGALCVWGWHELAFLTGAVAGTRRKHASGARGWARFREGTAAVIHHEIALAATALLLLSLSWGEPNQTGAAAFALLFALRLSAKLNIFLGVPNISDELLPAHLSYLKSYFGRPRFTAVLALSLIGSIALAAWLGQRAATTGEAGAALLFALAALGALEHLFLALPLRDGALWRWAIPARRRTSHEGGGYGL